ncbi:hypothetical protein EG329_000258 [Mollisiaceae sp. DMI_Dod_QoI]|nr:hypothetical protein EG329_000258 [Helotiales sp. DMI_Dod_QoI]
MALRFANAKEALCSFLDESKKGGHHADQQHIPLSSLPSPETPINIPSFPIEIRSETSVFRPKNIANLWAQLLSIQIQNGNFWKHENALALHKENTPAPTPSRDEVKAAELLRMEKAVLYLRHKMQKGLLMSDRPIIEAELPEMSRLLSKLESFGDLDFTIIRATKIHKVCKAVLRLDNVPGDDMYQFKARFAALYERYSKIQEQFESSDTARSALPVNPNQSTPQPKPISETLTEKEELKELPAICLTQLTPDQCTHIEEAAKSCDPPLDRGVVELMCMLPQFASKYGICDIQIMPQGKLIQPLDGFPELDRGIYYGGPRLPPHMVQLTWWTSPGYGIALFVDTRTGEGLQLRDFGLDDKGVVCTELEGPRRPIEELLQEWIDLFLEMRLVPSGAEDVMSDEFRSMDYLKQKFLLQEYGWPTSFPLSQSDYGSLIRRQANLNKERSDRWKTQSLAQKWNELTNQWHKINRTIFSDPTQTQEVERFKALDGGIERALRYHADKILDREYALAADVPLDKHFVNPLTLSPSSHIGSDWRVDVTPDMIIERFNEVVAIEDADTEKMKIILDGAYERWKLGEQGIHLPDYVDEEDDDSTSDYKPSEEECSEEEEFESDEEDEDLDFDIVMLEEDVTTDIESLRRDLEGYQISDA